MRDRSPISALPWILLAISLGAHGVLWTRREPAAVPVPAPVAPSLASIRAVEPMPPPSVPTMDVSSPPAVSVSPLQPAPPRPAVVYRNYVDIVAADLRTPEQVDDLNRVLARWAAIDPAGAGEWLAEREDGPFFAPAAELISSHLVAAGNVALALQWANMIKDPARHAQALQTVCGAAYRAGLIGEAQVRSSGLPQERIAAILSGAAID